MSLCCLRVEETYDVREEEWGGGGKYGGLCFVFEAT